MAATIAERRQREQAETAHLTDFERGLAQHLAGTRVMATAVAALIELGNTTPAVARLTAQPDSEIRRLRKLAARNEVPANGDAADRDAEPQASTASHEVNPAADNQLRLGDPSP